MCARGPLYRVAPMCVRLACVRQSMCGLLACVGVRYVRATRVCERRDVHVCGREVNGAIARFLGVEGSP